MGRYENYFDPIGRTGKHATATKKKKKNQNRFQFFSCPNDYDVKVKVIWSIFENRLIFVLGSWFQIKTKFRIITIFLQITYRLWPIIYIYRWYTNVKIGKSLQPEVELSFYKKRKKCCKIHHTRVLLFFAILGN